MLSLDQCLCLWPARLKSSAVMPGTDLKVGGPKAQRFTAVPPWPTRQAAVRLRNSASWSKSMGGSMSDISLTFHGHRRGGPRGCLRGRRGRRRRSARSCRRRRRYVTISAANQDTVARASIASIVPFVSVPVLDDRPARSRGQTAQASGLSAGQHGGLAHLALRVARLRRTSRHGVDADGHRAAARAAATGNRPLPWFPGPMTVTVDDKDNSKSVIGRGHLVDVVQPVR